MPSAAVSVSTQNANEIVAAPTSPKFIRVHGYVLAAAGTVSVKWQSASTDKTGAMPFVANDKLPVPSTPLDGWFDCAPGEALNLHLSAAVAVTGHVHYSVQG
jgi:hypothetical protein